MTTTTSALPAPERLSLAFLDLDRSNTPRCSARVCSGIFFLVGAGLVLLAALVDRWDRDLHDVSSPVDASKLCGAAQVARICSDSDRSLRLGGWADRLGRRPPQASRPFRRRRRHAYAAPWFLVGAHVLVDESRRRYGAHARVLSEVVPGPLQRSGPSLDGKVALHFPAVDVCAACMPSAE